MAPPSEQLDTLVAVLDLVRRGARTRPELVQRTGLGRKVVTQRVVQLADSGLVAEGDYGPSTGGRAPRELRFHADAGHLLVAQLGATSISVGTTDLAGHLLDERHEPARMSDGPDAVLGRVEELLDELLARRPAGAPRVWAAGIGVLGPVDAATGAPARLPVLVDWGGYPVRDRLARRYGVPVWADNECNLMALGELRAGLGRGCRDLILVKVGTGIGAGLICDGRLHRGARGAAGEVGHIRVDPTSATRCWCGNTGCLSALASGRALARDGAQAAADGRSPRLAAAHTAAGEIRATDVIAAAAAGDPASADLIGRAGGWVGVMVAGLVNSHNPDLVLIGGGLATAGDPLLAAVRQAVYQYALPLATRGLRIELSLLGDRAGLAGAAFMAADKLFSRRRLGLWIDAATPLEHADKIHAVV
ncbi:MULTISPECIES: ROK family protein [Polymorphospora]|uniref:ROK family protein n=1 Tax=Polymorphospora lycopeni TaxID=3140240 RepID=A0ABV5CSA0_9ACTN